MFSKKQVEPKTTLIQLPIPVLSKVMEFSDQETLNSLVTMSRLFKPILDNNLYRQLPAPSLNYSAFKTHYPTDKDKIELIHKKGGDSVAAQIQLSNRLLVSGTYAKNGAAQVCAWHLATGKLITEFTRYFGQVTALLEVKNNILAIAYNNGCMEFVDFNVPAKPKFLASMNLPQGEKITQFVLAAPGCIAFIAYHFEFAGPCYNRLGRLDFDPISITRDSIKTNYIVDKVSGVPNFYGSLFAFEQHYVAIVFTTGIALYDLNLDKNNMLIDTISFPKYKSHPYVMQLRTNMLATIFVTKESTKKYEMNIWDLTKKMDEAANKTIVLPMKDSTRGTHHAYQKNNGEILVISDDLFGQRILHIDMQAPAEKKVLNTISANLSGLSNSEFIEDGRYLLTHCGNRIDCIRFPLLNSQKNEEKIEKNTSRYSK